MDFLKELLHHCEHCLIDSAKMLPFLFLAFLLMEFVEHKAGDRFSAFLEKAGRSRFGGAAVGAALGCVPQCGFSIAASNLYSSRIIGAGTLMAVFVSTSDEAIPVMLAHPQMLGSLWKLIAAKVIIAIISGVVFSLIFPLFIKGSNDKDFEDICSSCGCGEHGIFVSSIKHTLEIFLFIFLVNLIMGFIIETAGEDNVSAFIDSMGIFQPFAAALVGLIPNCASSVILTELYADGTIPFGTAVGGLCTGAGMGLAVLFKTNKHMKENFLFLIYLYVTGIVSGLILNTLF